MICDRHCRTFRLLKGQISNYKDMVNLTMCLRKKNKKNNLTAPLRMPEFTSGRNMPGTVENNNTINILIDDRVRPFFF